MKIPFVDLIRNRLVKIAPDFDPAFYRQTYPDVAHITDDRTLFRHFREHGVNEGRAGNTRRHLALLKEKYGDLPSDFDPGDYLSLHDDLSRLGLTPSQALEHYLQYGRAEGRDYRRDCDIVRELYFPGQIISDADIRELLANDTSPDGKLRSGADIMRSKGLSGGGSWIEKIQLDEFQLLNAHWAGETATLMQAVDAVLARGCAYFAPLSFDLTFDPQFYRETKLELHVASDEDCYRHWLFVGLESGDPGSARQYFRSHALPLREFPRGFAWRRYLREHRLAPQTTRWAALSHYLKEGFARSESFIESDESGEFFAALGEHFHRRNATLAIKAYRQAERFAPLADDALERLGDLYYFRKQWDAALELYNRRRRSLDPASATIRHAADCALKLGRVSLALDILSEGGALAIASPEGRSLVDVAIQAEFDNTIEQARKDADIVSGDELNARIVDLFARVVENYQRLDPLGAPLPHSLESKVALIADAARNASATDRAQQMRRHLAGLSDECESYSYDQINLFMRALPGASIAIFYHRPVNTLIIRALEYARALGIPTYYDIDEIAFAQTNCPLDAALFGATLQRSDYAIAASPKIAAYTEPLVRRRRAFLLPSGPDLCKLTYLNETRSPLVRNSVTACYRSTDARENFNTLTGAAILAAMRRHDSLKLLVIGPVTLTPDFDRFGDRVIRILHAEEPKEYLSLLAEADINLVPFTTDPASTKVDAWLDAAALSIPSILPEAAGLQGILEHGVDALVANTIEEWTQALDSLIVNLSLRRSIGDNARSKATSTGMLANHAQFVEQMVVVAQAPPLRKKNRILLVNLHFYPQSHGGATRVVTDNLDCFLDSGAIDHFDFAVATTDLDGEDRNEFRVENYRGCPVFRVSAPALPNIEWRYDIPQMGEAFRRILSLWPADLVHFHCIQRFSGAIVEACLELGVPYLVTAHDAWWISDWKFLADDKNRLRDPCEAFPFDPPGGATIAQSLERRRMLAALLTKAEAILCVSETLARIYRSCGFVGARAVPNGAPALPLAPRRPSDSQRVRLAYLGGMLKFKGFHLLQAALRAGRFDNLELTIVDHTRYGGHVVEDDWGGVPVRFIGKSHADNMPEFYARHDVLIAPSLWPEPFGLVTREALAAGLWVIASDRGAIGEDVAQGVNGWIITVATPNPLREALRTIDADPTRYRSPPPATELRKAQDQANDLVELYRETLSRPYQKKIDRRPTVASLTGLD